MYVLAVMCRKSLYTAVAFGFGICSSIPKVSLLVSWEGTQICF